MHKVYVYVDSTDAGGQSTVATAVTEVLAVHGMGIYANAEDAQISTLESSGFIVETVDQIDQITLNSVVIDTTATAPVPPAGWVTSGDVTYWLVHFKAPALPSWLEALTGTGAQIVDFISESTAIVNMTAIEASSAEALDHVRWVGAYEPLYKVAPELAGEEGPVPATELSRLTAADGAASGNSGEMVDLYVELFEEDQMSTIQSLIESNSGSVEETSSDVIICQLPRSGIDAIVTSPVVAQIYPYIEPSLCMQFARPITQVQQIVNTHGLTGLGETVAVCDTGLDRGIDNETIHTDFKKLNGVETGRIKRGYDLGRPGRWDDPHGHGTHVSGIILGNGRSATTGRPQSGVAYQAELVMQSVLDVVGGLGGISANLNNLFGPVYDNDSVRIHNNSWATSGVSWAQYLNNSRQIDQFVWRNPDILIVFAAANEATDNNRSSADPGAAGGAGGNGVVNLRSISTQAANRNGLTVGGTENQHPGSSGINQTWGIQWGTGSRFWNPPLRNDNVADNNQHMMKFSGRGPTTAAAGNRIKPDVVAPGSSILSAFSRLSASSNFWGPQPPGSVYTFKGGTSMAAPYVSGMCALIRQYLREVQGLSDPDNPDRKRRRPSAALIRTLLVHGAQQITGINAANAGTVPSNHQGWGRVDLRRSLFSNPVSSQVSAADAGWLPRKTIFLDSPDITLNGIPEPAANSRVNHEVRIRVTNTNIPLRATLVWTDYPGPTAHPGTLINRLQLSTIRVQGVNTRQPPITVPVALRNNNIQQIDISLTSGTPLQASDYIIQVAAPAVLPSVGVAQEEQDFALVISGSISHSDHANPGNMAALPDLAFVDLSVAGDGTVLHDGLAPSPERPEGNLGSPDIWLTTESETDPANTTDRIEAGQTYNVYIRVHNLGFAKANDATVSMFWADPTTPMEYPADWQSDGVEVGNDPRNHASISVNARSSEILPPFKWTPPQDREHIALFARVEHADDPIRHPDNLRMDNNITRRDVFVQNNSTEVQGDPSWLGRVWFFIISGFGSPRDIEARWLTYYQDIRDGEVKPIPPGVEVEVWDYDPVTGDDRLALGRTAASTDADGNAASAIRLTFSTYESGERGPDLYCRILSPGGAEFSEFRRNSYFVNGAPYWHSKIVPVENGGFYEEDFSGNRLGITSPLSMTMRLTGIQVHVSLEYLDIVSNEFEAFPAGMPVKIMDSKASAPRPLMAQVTTDDNGEIRAILQKRVDYEPSVYFLIEKDDSVEPFVFVSYFHDNDSWDSRQRQVALVARDGGVSTRSGHFENVDEDTLVEEGERLRFRISGPRISLHLRFEYYNREAAGYVALPEGTKLEAWKDDAGATSPLVTGRVGGNGSAELSVPKGSEEQLDLYVRVVMDRKLESGTELPAEVEVHSGGNVITWETRGKTATDGTTAGLFNDVENEFPTSGDPLTFRIGTGPGDATHEHSAPYILSVIGDVHNWLRTRTDGNFHGSPWLQVNLSNTAGEGSKFQQAGFPSVIHINTGHQAHDSQQLNTGSRQNDQWNRLVIAHQYAHVVFEMFFLSPGRTEVSIPNHRNFNTEDELGNNLTARRRAFTEGFADFIAFRHLSQKARPLSDVSTGGWTAQGAADLRSALAGEKADDNTVIRSAIAADAVANPANATCEVRLTVVADPRTSAISVSHVPFRSSGYLVRFRYRSAGQSQSIDLTVKVIDNATERTSWSLRSTSNEWTTAAFTLTPQQADSISNYANLRLRFIATGGNGANRQIEISWIDFELPHTERPDRDNQQLSWRGSDNNGANSSGERVPVAIANMFWHLDNTVVGWEHAGIEEPVNQRRFQALIWNAVRSLNDENHQLGYHFYRAVQTATLSDEDHIDGDSGKTRQEVRRVFDANGMVYTRGQIHNRIAGATARVSQEHLAAAPPTTEIWGFQVRPADQARLNIAEMGQITAYRIDAAPAGNTNFVELDTVTQVTNANQRETINVNFTEARQTAILQIGNHDFLVRAMDEFNTWDTFADNFTGNNDPNANSNDMWQRDRTRSIRPLTGDPVIVVPANTP